MWESGGERGGFSEMQRSGKGNGGKKGGKQRSGKDRKRSAEDKVCDGEKKRKGKGFCVEFWFCFDLEV